MCEGPIEVRRGGVLGGRVRKGRLQEAREVVQVGLGRDGRDRNLDEEETDGHEGVQGGHVACTGEVRVFKLNLFNLFWWFQLRKDTCVLKKTGVFYVFGIDHTRRNQHGRVGGGEHAPSAGCRHSRVIKRAIPVPISECVESAAENVVAVCIYALLRPSSR